MLVTILKKYIWVLNLILLTGLAYALALTVNGKIKSGISSNKAIASPNLSTFESGTERAFRRPVPESDYDIIVKRNIFGVENVGSSGSEQVVGTSGPAPETKMNLELLGTIIKPQEKSVAIIKNADNGKVDGYIKGDGINIIEKENVKLVRVEHCKAVIERAGKGQEAIRCKDLGDTETPVTASARENTDAASGRRAARDNESNKYEEGINKLGENDYEISRQLLEEVLSDPTQIVQQARVIPQKDGLRFFGIRSNSIFSQIGIKNGDTLQRINNVELNDVERALGVFEELRAQSYFTIEFQRAGKSYKNEYTVK